MSKFKIVQKIKEIYDSGENVIQFLRDAENGQVDSESIMISYDLQAGTYTKLAEENADYIDQYSDAIITIFHELSDVSSVMEVGVGEATLMNPLMTKLDPQDKLNKFGFDISWSRTRYALENSLKAENSIDLFMANLFSIPLPDNSVDVVYTSHSLEPNGGQEKIALQELYRVAKKYLVLLEPDYENASQEGKHRIEYHGYVKDLVRHAQELGYQVIESRPFEVVLNPLNPTGLTIIKKESQAAPFEKGYICPVTKLPLRQYSNCFYCETGGLIYPVIDNIPCLVDSSAVLGMQFGKFNSSIK